MIATKAQAVEAVKKAIESAKCSNDIEAVGRLTAYLDVMMRDLEAAKDSEAYFQRTTRPRLVAKWAKNMDFRPR